MKNYKKVKYCDTMEEATAILRNMVADDCRTIGITDWKLINRIINEKQHRYMVVCDYEFDEVGNFVCARGYEVIRKRV